MGSNPTAGSGGSMQSYESFLDYRDKQLKAIPADTFENEIADDIFELYSLTSLDLNSPITVLDNTENDEEDAIRKIIEKWEAEGRIARVINRLFWVYDYGGGKIYTQFLDAKILIYQNE